MAWVEKRGKKFSVCYRVEDETGNFVRKRKSGYTTEAEAWKDADRLENLSAIGADIHGDRQTCGYVMEKWFGEYCLNAGLAMTTLSKYRYGIERLAKTFVYDMQVCKLGPSTVSTLITLLQKGERKAQLTMLSAVGFTEPLRLSLSWAAQSGMIPKNPFDRIRLPKIPKAPQKTLNDYDIDELVVGSIGNQFRIPLLLALYGGLRREEAAALRWNNIDFARRTITILEARTRTVLGKEDLKGPKSETSRRTISMPRFVMDELHDVAKPSDHVCVTERGEPYQLDSYSQAVQRMIEKINAKRKGTRTPPMPLASYKDLRHTHAAMCIRKGFHPKVIQERLGHASIKITMDTYGYLMVGLQEEVADAFDAEFQRRKSGGKSGGKPPSKGGKNKVLSLPHENPEGQKSEENQHFSRF